MKPAAKPGTETEARAALLRQIPSVDELLALSRLKTLAGRVDRALVVEIARAVLANVRARITDEREITAVALNSAELEGWIAAEVERVLALSLQPVINATGVVLHTNLGRAPLPAEAIEHLRQTAAQYSNLEYDLAAGARGKRDVHTARLIERLAGGQGAILGKKFAGPGPLGVGAPGQRGGGIGPRGGRARQARRSHGAADRAAGGRRGRHRGKQLRCRGPAGAGRAGQRRRGHRLARRAD